MLAHLKQSPYQQVLQIFIKSRINASYYIQVFLGEFERSLFEAHVARRVLQKETKVDVY